MQPSQKQIPLSTSYKRLKGGTKKCCHMFQVVNNKVRNILYLCVRKHNVKLKKNPSHHYEKESDKERVVTFKQREKNQYIDKTDYLFQNEREYKTLYVR